MKRLSFVSLFILFCSIAVVLFASPALAAPVSGGTLVYQLDYKPSGIDPLFAQDPNGFLVSGALFDGLTHWDYVTGEVQPAVAASWESNAGVTVWTFHLRHGVKFTNGRVVSAKDFKVAWERLFKGNTANYLNYLLAEVKGSGLMMAGKAQHLSGVVAADDETLVVTLKHPYADFPAVVGHPVLAPVPRALMGTYARRVAFHNKPIGNGPFKLAVAWNKGATIRLVANPAYYGSKPYIAGVRFTTITDPAVVTQRWTEGKLDVCRLPVKAYRAAVGTIGVSPDGYTAQPGQQAVPGPTAAVGCFVFNNKKAPLNNANVRRAISLAIDRSKLGVAGIDAAATDVVPPAIPGSTLNAWLYTALDRVQAAALLADAGYPGGVGLPTITCIYPAGWGFLPRITQIKSDLATVGITLKPVKLTADAYLTRIYSGNYMTGNMGWFADYPVAYDFLYPLFESTQNVLCSFYDNLAVDAALRDAQKTLDPMARLAAYEAIDATIGADAPVAPLLHYGRQAVCSARLHDATLSPMELFDFTKVWIQ